MFLKLERSTANLEVTTTKRRALAKGLVYRVHGKEDVLLALKFMQSQCFRNTNCLLSREKKNLKEIKQRKLQELKNDLKRKHYFVVLTNEEAYSHDVNGPIS